MDLDSLPFSISLSSLHSFLFEIFACTLNHFRITQTSNDVQCDSIEFFRPVHFSYSSVELLSSIHFAAFFENLRLTSTAFTTLSSTANKCNNTKTSIRFIRFFLSVCSQFIGNLQRSRLNAMVKARHERKIFRRVGRLIGCRGLI